MLLGKASLHASALQNYSRYLFGAPYRHNIFVMGFSHEGSWGTRTQFTDAALKRPKLSLLTEKRMLCENNAKMNCKYSLLLMLYNASAMLCWPLISSLATCAH